MKKNYLVRLSRQQAAALSTAWLEDEIDQAELGAVDYQLTNRVMLSLDASRMDKLRALGGADWLRDRLNRIIKLVDVPEWLK